MPSASATVTRKALLSPLLREVRVRREPVASVTMDAVTPAPAALILSRICVS